MEITEDSKILEMSFKVTGTLEDQELLAVLGQRGTDLSLTISDLSKTQRLKLLKELLKSSQYATQWGFRMNRLGSLQIDEPSSSRYRVYSREYMKFVNHISHLNSEWDSNRILDEDFSSSSARNSLRGFPSYDHHDGRPIKGDVLLNSHVRRVIGEFFKLTEDTAVAQSIASNLYNHLFSSDLSIDPAYFSKLSPYFKQSIYYDMDSAFKDAHGYSDLDEISFQKFWNKNMTNVMANLNFVEGSYAESLAIKRKEATGYSYPLPRTLEGLSFLNQITESAHSPHLHTAYLPASTRDSIAGAGMESATINDLI